MRIYVFSYNRGIFLRNCLESIFRHASQFPVTVVDDGSTDPEVEKVTEDFDSRITLIQNSKEHKDQYLGGLYTNMQYAIDKKDSEELVLFIQDDQQIVRDLDKRDENHWKRFFDAYSNAFELTTNFLKAELRNVQSHFQIDPEVPVYFRDSTISRRAHFAATGIFHKKRMCAVEWRFQLTEGWNEEAVRKLGYKMGITPYPFMMWLPNAKSAKFQRKGLMHRFAEWYRKAGFYPYLDMTQEEVTWLQERDIYELPVAQNILRPDGMKENQKWLFEDATKSIRFIHRHLKKKKKRNASNINK